MVNRRRRCLGKEAGGSHAGDGIGFQDINVIAANDRVGAAIAPAAQGLMGFKTALLDPWWSSRDSGGPGRFPW